MKISKVMSVFCPKRMDKLRDMMTWHLCYEKGLREPRFPVPAVRYEWEWVWELHPQPGKIHIALVTYGPYEENVR